jgi:Tfp pilus assembly protein PilV
MRTVPVTGWAGFSLVETLAASVILSASVLALGAISMDAVGHVRLNRHYEVAASLIDKQLTLIDCVGIDQFVEKDQMSGVFEQFEPGYQWEASTEYQGTDDLYLVTITITWMDGNQPYKVTAQTMLNGTGLVAAPQTVSP